MNKKYKYNQRIIAELCKKYNVEADTVRKSLRGDRTFWCDAFFRNKECELSQSFPLDYDFGTDNPAKVQYVLGMSVPPIMVAKVVDRIYNQWNEVFK